MRKIEKKMIEAILTHGKMKEANTRVTTETRGDGALVTSVYLHDNLIAQSGADGKWGFKLCGWNTPTTRSRLSAIISTLYKDAHCYGVSSFKGTPRLVYGDRKPVPVDIHDWFWVTV